MRMVERGWRVLLIGGPSGVGKTVVARTLGRRLGASWLQVDDIRLAFQRAGARLPNEADTRALNYFIQTSDVWSQAPELLRDALLAVGEALAPALEVIIENHVDTDAPVIIEGDGILPSLLARPPVAERVARGHVRAVFLVETSREALYRNMLDRGRGYELAPEAARRAEARAKWLYSYWIEQEATRLRLPVITSRPWTSLPRRVLSALALWPDAAHGTTK